MSDHFETTRHENGTKVSECLHNVTSVTSHVTLRFAPLATETNFGSSDFIGSLRGKSEMTLNGMSSDPHNRVNSLDLSLMRLPQIPENNTAVPQLPKNIQAYSLKCVRFFFICKA